MPPTHIYKLGSPYCTVCGQMKQPYDYACQPPQPIPIPDNKEFHHYNCGICGCSHKGYEGAKNCDHGGKGFILIGRGIHVEDNAADYCGNERPPRKVFCQLKHPHVGSHRAIIYWEDE